MVPLLVRSVKTPFYTTGVTCRRLSVQTDTALQRSLCGDVVPLQPELPVLPLQTPRQQVGLAWRLPPPVACHIAGLGVPQLAQPELLTRLCPVAVDNAVQVDVRARPLAIRVHPQDGVSVV